MTFICQTQCLMRFYYVSMLWAHLIISTVHRYFLVFFDLRMQTKAFLYAKTSNNTFGNSMKNWGVLSYTLLYVFLKQLKSVFKIVRLGSGRLYQSCARCYRPYFLLPRFCVQSPCVRLNFLRVMCLEDEHAPWLTFS